MAEPLGSCFSLMLYLQSSAVAVENTLGNIPMVPDNKILVAKGISPQSNQNKKVTSNTGIKHGDPGEETISSVDMGGSTYLRNRQPGCPKNQQLLLL